MGRGGGGVLGAPRGCAGRGGEGDGTGEADAECVEEGGNGGGGDKAGGSAPCGRTGRGAPGRLRPSLPGPCGASWMDEECAR